MTYAHGYGELYIDPETDLETIQDIMDDYMPAHAEYEFNTDELKYDITLEHNEYDNNQWEYLYDNIAEYVKEGYLTFEAEEDGSLESWDIGFRKGEWEESVPLLIHKHSLENEEIEIIEEIINKNIYQKRKDTDTFDCVLIEKDLFDGLTPTEMVKTLKYFPENSELIPIEISGSNTSAMGFITQNKAEEINFKYYNNDKLYDEISKIINDITLENVFDEYEIKTENNKTVKVKLTRNI